MYLDWRRVDTLDDCINDKRIVAEFGVAVAGFDFVSNIESAMSAADLELKDVEEHIAESIETVKRLTPECDKIDYILAATSGAICGVIDIFLVGKPRESPVGEITDKWFENRTMDFAKLCGWDGKDNPCFSSAVKYLEKKFKIPYDQRGAGDAASGIFDLNPRSHHFKSLGHNPTLLGLFFSILDQFNNTSHFVSEEKMISLQEADSNFDLRGSSTLSKLFCGFVNWLGHLVSDMSGSSSSKGRGMGIPSPLWSWTNDVIAIKRKLNISVSEFDKGINDLALRIYKESYDTRFQTAQAIPVIINELLVRTIYSIRRLLQYFSNVNKEDRSFDLLWKTCEPFSDATVKRMLIVAHGTFCLIDAGDAVARGFIAGGSCFNIAEFFMRLNIIGVGRFAISLYGEVKKGNKKNKAKEEAYFLMREKIALNEYIDGLKIISEIYDDRDLLTFVNDLKNSELYKQAFEKTIILAEKRSVPEDKILRTKADIDSYFIGGNV